MIKRILTVIGLVIISSCLYANPAETSNEIKQLEQCKCQKCDFSNANLVGLEINKAQENFCKLDNINFNQANFKDSILHNVSFKNAILTDANFNGSTIWPISFKGANLKNADLSNSKIILRHRVTSLQPFHNVDLSYVNLSGMKVYFIHAGKKQEVKPLDILWDAKLCHTTMPDGSINNRDCSQYKWWHAIINNFF